MDQEYQYPPNHAHRRLHNTRWPYLVCPVFGKYRQVQHGDALCLDGESVLQAADYQVKIPMFGFTESFNISVSAALTMHHLSEKLRKSDLQWMLSNEERIDVMLAWAKSVVKSADQIEHLLYPKF